MNLKHYSSRISAVAISSRERLCFVLSSPRDHFPYKMNLRDPAFGKGIPVSFSRILSGKRNAILERNTLPSSLHEVSNILVRVAIGVVQYLTVVLSPKLSIRDLWYHK